MEFRFKFLELQNRVYAIPAKSSVELVKVQHDPYFTGYARNRRSRIIFGLSI